MASQYIFAGSTYSGITHEGKFFHGKTEGDMRKDVLKKSFDDNKANFLIIRGEGKIKDTVFRRAKRSLTVI